MKTSPTRTVTFFHLRILKIKIQQASNVVFDNTGHFIIYPGLVGVKIVNVETNRVCRVLGKVESGERFTALSLYQVGCSAAMTAWNGGGDVTVTST